MGPESVTYAANAPEPLRDRTAEPTTARPTYVVEHGKAVLVVLLYRALPISLDMFLYSARIVVWYEYQPTLDVKDAL